MPDFVAKFVSGTTIFDWEDPEEGAEPSRINHFDGRPPRHHVGSINDAIAIQCTVDGVAGPADAALGGRLFTMRVVEGPMHPGVSQPMVGVSAYGEFVPTVPGHYVVNVFRPEGGSYHLHVDVLT